MQTGLELRSEPPSVCFAPDMDGSAEMPKSMPRPLQPVPRHTLTRKEAAASLGISLNHFERWVQPELKVVLSGQLVLIPVPELERWVQRHARLLVDPPVRRLRESSG